MSTIRLQCLKSGSTFQDQAMFASNLCIFLRRKETWSLPSTKRKGDLLRQTLIYCALYLFSGSCLKMMPKSVIKNTNIAYGLVDIHHLWLELWNNSCITTNISWIKNIQSQVWRGVFVTLLCCLIIWWRPPRNSTGPSSGSSVLDVETLAWSAMSSKAYYNGKENHLARTRKLVIDTHSHIWFIWQNILKTATCKMHP